MQTQTWSLPRGRITITNQCNTEQRATADVILLSVRGLAFRWVRFGESPNASQLQNGQTLRVPYNSNREILVTVPPLTYPNTTRRVTAYQWSIPSGWTSPHQQGDNTEFVTYLLPTHNEFSILVTPDACSGGQIRVRPLDVFCHNQYVEELKGAWITINVERTSPGILITNLTSSSTSVPWGRETSVTFTAAVNPDFRVQEFEWTVSGNFTQTGTFTTTTNTFQGVHRGFSSGTVSVRAIYCGGRRSAARSVNVNYNPNTLPALTGGTTTICDQATFTVTNLPAGATVIWNVPTNTRRISSTNSSIVLERNTAQPTGPGLVSAMINLPGGATRAVSPREVQVGPPNSQWITTRYNLTHVTPSVPFVDNALFHGFSGNLQSIDWIEWRRLSNVDINVHHSGVNVPGERATVTAHFPGSNTSAQAQIRLQNQCGPSPWVTIEYLRHVFSPPPPPPFCLNCFGVGCIICIPAAGPCTCMLYPCICMIAWGAVHPNPVSNVLTIDLTQVETPEAFTLSDRVRTSTSDRARTSEVFNIRLFNAHGMIVRQQRTRAATIQFDVSNLPEGTYYLHIEHNGEIEKHQIIVQRN